MNTCTRMLWSVQWCMGENETTCGSLSWRKEDSASIEPAGLGLAQLRGVGQDRPPLGAVDGRRVSQAVSPPNRSLSTAVRAEAGSAVRSGQSDAGTDPM